MCNERAIIHAQALLAAWMQTKAVVRFIGAGRALQAIIMPSNRLAHGGAVISHMGGLVPMPAAELGGGIIACSASGLTAPVLQAMKTARERNDAIEILGLSKHTATQFGDLCNVFIGVHTPDGEFGNPLSALADTEEYVMSEILDALVVLAGLKNGYTDEVWRRGHEDIGPTGPHFWQPTLGAMKSQSDIGQQHIHAANGQKLFHDPRGKSRASQVHLAKC
jgi:D-arabinose 5-phosphate isomerase GutQ